MYDQDAVINLLQNILDELQEIRRYIGYLGNHLQSGDKVYITTYKSPTFGRAVTSAAPAPATSDIRSGSAVATATSAPATPDSHQE